MLHVVNNKEKNKQNHSNTGESNKGIKLVGKTWRNITKHVVNVTKHGETLRNMWETLQNMEKHYETCGKRDKTWRNITKHVGNVTKHGQTLLNISEMWENMRMNEICLCLKDKLQTHFLFLPNSCGDHNSPAE